MFSFIYFQLLALSRSSGNLEDLEIDIPAAQRHMHQGYQVYWICGMTSIEFHRNTCDYISVIFIHNIFGFLKRFFN